MSDPSSPADSAPELTSRFRVGEWLVESELHRIERDEEIVPLEPRIMHVLVCLARRAGQVATRDTLLDEVWGDVTVQEEALTHAISRLRRAFGDRARSAQYIETIPKRGYRLIAPVVALSPPAPAPPRKPAPATDEGSDPATPASPPRRSPRASAVVGVLAGVIVVVVAAFGFDRWREAPTSVPAALEGTPLTSMPGRETVPAISPDGTRIAFVQDNGTEATGDLYVVQRGRESCLRLTYTPEVEHEPRWSHDGTHLVFLASDDTSTKVRIVPALGGPARTVYEHDVRGGIGGVDWLPDGKALVISVLDETPDHWELQRLVLDTGEREPLPIEPVPPIDEAEGLRGDWNPRVDGTGERVVFRRTDAFGHSDLHVASLLDGTRRRLTFGQGELLGFDWTADGRAVVFSSGTAFAGEFRLWRVDVETGELRWLPTRDRRSIRPSIARGTGALVYEQERFHCHIVRAPTTRAPRPEAEPIPFARSSHSEYSAVHSPSGTKVAFISTRSGDPEIWISDENGVDPRRVTSFDGANIEFIRWSPDERRVAYDVTSSSRSAVYVTDVERTATRPLTSSDEDEILMSWSTDSTAVYYRAFDGEQWRTKHTVTEDGRTKEIFPFRAFMVFEEAETDTLLYTVSGDRALRRHHGEGKEEEIVLDDPAALMPCYWKRADDGIFFYRASADGYQLAFFDFATGTTRDLLPLPHVRWNVLDVALDGNSLLYDQVDRVEADLVVVDEFD